MIAPEVKLCECGCGSPAPIAERTYTSKGHTKGQPIRFVLGHQVRVRRHDSPADRFWKKVDLPENRSACWIWQGSKNPCGYGQMRIRGTLVSAHRFSWEMTNGEIPDGLSVLHKCDTPACVNPAHLFLGTQRDNVRDMMQKGRFVQHPNHGEYNSFAKLTEADVIAIREQRKRGAKPVDLALTYNVNKHTIYDVISRRTWRHIP